MSAKYNLEERTFEFARDVRFFLKTLPRTTIIMADVKQVVRSSGSIGANDIEANENVGKRDFIYRLKVSRKEAKETIYWLRLICISNELSNASEGARLIDEANQIRRILSAIIKKSE